MRRCSEGGGLAVLPAGVGLTVFVSAVIGVVYLAVLVYFITLASRFVKAVEKIAEKMGS